MILVPVAIITGNGDNGYEICEIYLIPAEDYAEIDQLEYVDKQFYDRIRKIGIKLGTVQSRPDGSLIVTGIQSMILEEE